MLTPVGPTRCWRFRCPRCNIPDEELGTLAADDELDCMVCEVADGISVTLDRWRDPDEGLPSASPQKRLRLACG
jgi:hypothetical protein